jgi:hypothetical protein
LNDTGCKINHLDLKCNQLNDECMNILVGSLAQNTTIKSNDLNHQELVTPSGWCTFIPSLSKPACSLNKLFIGDNEIGDEGATCLEDTLMLYNVSLKELDVSGCDIDDVGAYENFQGLAQNSSITSDGWCLYSELFESTASSQLTELRIGSVDILLNQPNIDNDTFIDIVYSLSYNSSTCLEILTFDSAEVSASGWDALASVLCNDSSIDEIAYGSNHILNEINGLVLPGSIENLLSINSIEDKAEVKRQKLSWIGRDSVGLSAMFNLLRSKPSLIPMSTSRGNKRKRKSETLGGIINH